MDVEQKRNIHQMKHVHNSELIPMLCWVTIKYITSWLMHVQSSPYCVLRELDSFGLLLP